MTAAQSQALERRRTPDLRLNFVKARFEALAEWGIPSVDAMAIAEATEIDIVLAIGLLRHGCQPDLIIPILGS